MCGGPPSSDQLQTGAVCVERQTHAASWLGQDIGPGDTEYHPGGREHIHITFLFNITPQITHVLLTNTEYHIKRFETITKPLYLA